MEHLVFREEGVLIPRELFSQPQIIAAELAQAGILPPQNGMAKLPLRQTETLDLSRELHWLQAHQQEFVGQWVALDGDRLVSHGTNAREVSAAARAAGVAVPFIIQIDPPDELPFGGW